MVRDPDREKNEGYRAAREGLSIDRNPHPPGTLRFDDWRRGWHLRQAETQVHRDHAEPSMEVAGSIDENPHPRGTIRFEEWRRAWLMRHSGTRGTVPPDC